ncbi:type IV toxin-antitoxin system AbiEi family antitoxin [Luteimonas sp. MJ204]|uniref:type IV toxin-antitoxin system AbiEi family antitoxin n=1 Tax=Luteimonas sp. MJ145 TaxID=3129234 RepID=UPI0031BAC8EF
MRIAETRAAEALRELLERVSAITVVSVDQQVSAAGDGVDILVHLEAAGQPRILACEVKSSGQPRYARAALLQLRNYVARKAQGAIPVFVAPYLSPNAQSMCREEGVGFLDFEGNAHLSFDGIFIDRQVANKPDSERRGLKSLFTPKSAQVLRVLLRQPDRAWRVVELAEAAAVSVGHVSNVRNGLLDREWAEVSDDGLLLARPEALLDEWASAYEPPAGKRLGFYTTLHGRALEDAARQTLHAGDEGGQAVFASYSAAQWLAPYARTGTQYFYADQKGLERLHGALGLSAASKGQNVIVALPKDAGLFRDTVEPAPGAVCTSPVQTYLDLRVAGERGAEAADHLRREMLAWQKT